MSSEKKHIGFYCSSTSWGGLEMNFVQHASWLAEFGYSVKVFLIKGSPLDKAEWPDRGIEIRHIRRNRKYFDIISAIRIKSLFKKENVKIVWITDTRDMSLMSWVKGLGGGKLKVIYRQAMRLGVDKKDFFHTMRFKSIDRWISTLAYMAREVVDKTRIEKEKIAVIPLALDLNEYYRRAKDSNKEIYDFGIPEGKLVFGIIGRIDPHKGQLFVIERLPEVLNLIPNAHLLIVGEVTKNEGDDYMTLLQNRVEELGIADHVTFHPFLKEKEKFYDRTDVVIVSSRAETFGMVTIEAMASGKTILGTNTAGTPELLGHGKFGLMYQPEHEESFLEGIRALRDKTKRDELASNARIEAFERFSLKKWCIQTDQIIQSLQ